MESKNKMTLSGELLDAPCVKHQEEKLWMTLRIYQLSKFFQQRVTSKLKSEDIKGLDKRLYDGGSVGNFDKNQKDNSRKHESSWCTAYKQPRKRCDSLDWKKSRGRTNLSQGDRERDGS